MEEVILVEVIEGQGNKAYIEIINKALVVIMIETIREEIIIHNKEVISTKEDKIILIKEDKIVLVKEVEEHSDHNMATMVNHLIKVTDNQNNNKVAKVVTTKTA